MSKTAIVHDYFTQQGGAERVAEQLFQMLPESDIFTTVALSSKLPPGIPSRRVQTSWMQHLPALSDLYRFYFPLYPFGVSSLDLSTYDLVITSSSGYVKGVHTRSSALHVCYCHTPMRWVWRYNDYSERENFSFSKRLLLPSILKGLKHWDMDASRQPDQYVANSQVVAQRIQECYKREAVVIPPPIDVDRFTIGKTQADYYLALSRLVPYKRIDLAIQACNLLKRKLVIIGEGTDRKRLEQIAGKTISFLGRLSDLETSRYASESLALLFPGEEDFGLVPLELAAAGRPTIAYRAGGATETVLDGKTGVFFDKPDPRSLADAILSFEQHTWDSSEIRKHALGFDVRTFRQRFGDLLISLGAEIQLAHSRDTASASIGELASEQPTAGKLELAARFRTA